MRTYRITNRFRFIAFVVISIIVIISIANFILGFNTANSETAQEFIQFEVSYGDTLWDIAELYKSEDMSIQEAVFEIRTLNNITSKDLVPGMILEIPVN